MLLFIRKGILANSAQHNRRIACYAIPVPSYSLLTHQLVVSFGVPQGSVIEPLIFFVVFMRYQEWEIVLKHVY